MPVSVLKCEGAQDNLLVLDKPVISLGRSPLGVTYVLKHKRISAQHAILRRIENFWTIEDLNSRNGVYVNEERIASNALQRVKVGDRISFGVKTFQSVDGLSYTLCKISRKVLKTYRSFQNGPSSHNPRCVRKTSSRSLQTTLWKKQTCKELSIMLARCDDEKFLLPPGVKLFNDNKKTERVGSIEIDVLLDKVLDEDDLENPMDSTAKCNQHEISIIDLCSSDEEVNDCGGDGTGSLDKMKGYSQDDVIVLDDEDDYDDLGFQAKFLNFHIKDEIKKEILDLDEELFDEEVTHLIAKIKQENPCVLDELASGFSYINEHTATAWKTEDSDIGIEKHFIKEAIDVTSSSPVPPEKVLDPKPSLKIDNEIPSLLVNKFQENDYTLDDSSTKDEQAKTDTQPNRTHSSTKNRPSVDRLKLSTNEIMTFGPKLIDAQPLLKKSKSSKNSAVVEEAPIPPCLVSPTKKLPTALPSGKKDHKSKKMSLKKTCLNKCGHRIRVPGDESDDHIVNKQPKIIPSLPTKKNNVKSNETTQRTTVPFNENINSQTRNVNKNTLPHVPSSRSDRLLESILRSSTEKPNQLSMVLPQPSRPTKTLQTENHYSHLNPSDITVRVKTAEHQLDVTVKSLLSKRTSSTNNSLENLNKRVRFSEELNSTCFVESRDELLTSNQPLIKCLEYNDITPKVFSALFVILHWSQQWLDEQEFHSQPPPLIDYRSMRCTKLSYSSLEEYVSTFKQMLFLDIWEKMSEKWRQISGKCLEYHMVLSGVSGFEENGKRVSIINCCGIIASDHAGDYPSEGWLTLLKIPVHAESQQSSDAGSKLAYVQLFAYIRSCHKSSYEKGMYGGGGPLLEQSARHCQGKMTLLTVSFLTKAKPMNIQQKRSIKVLMLTKLSSVLQMFECLHNLMDNSLTKTFLAPSKELFQDPPVSSRSSLATTGIVPYSEVQKYSILHIADACILNQTTPSVCLIEGLPGTGKTTVVAALTTQILTESKTKDTSLSPIVLLCAPSNSAVDEAVQKLLDCRSRLKDKNDLRIVRLGEFDKVHKTVQPIHVDTHIKRNEFLRNKTHLKLKECITNVVASIKDLQAKLKAVQCSGKASETMKCQWEISKLQKSHRDLERQLLKNRPPTCESETAIYKNQREVLLLKANVIATTLDYCCHELQFLKIRKRPVICIVDEASKCFEPEILLPLQFNVHKLVLVGDSCQLPLSNLPKAARERGYSLSLFTRLHNICTVNHRMPAITFNVQYRMNSEICHFPSEILYNKQLQTDWEMQSKMADVPFAPYIFFNVVDGEQLWTSSHDYHNLNEALFVCCLCEVLLLKNDTFTIGIIATTAGQKRAIYDAVQNSIAIKRFLPDGILEIDTVDKYQGREKDIIIISATKADTGGSRKFDFDYHKLGVALTRGRSVVYICGHAKSLQEFAIWMALVRDAQSRGKFENVSSKIMSDTLQDLIVTVY